MSEPLSSTVSGNSYEQQNLVAFRMNGQTYALPIEPIVQILPMVTVTPLPGVGGSLEGIINVRGAAVPVVNLRRHLGLPETPLRLHTPIVLVQADGHMVGLIVDEVTEVLDLPAGEVTSLTDVLPEWLGEAPALQGLARTQENGTLLLLDLEQLCLAEQAHALAQAVAALPDVEETADGPL